MVNGQISVDALTAFTWTFTAFAIALTLGRYAIRWHKFHAFGWDDLLHGIATILMIILISIYAPHFPLYYKVEYYAAGVGPQPTEAELEKYFRIELANSMLFWVIMYTVKFTFMMLYRHVFGVSRTFMRAWWLVFGFTAITFFICFLSDLWVCGHPSDLGNLKVCLAPPARALSRTMVIWKCPVHVVSDLLIVCLPMGMLIKLKLPTSQKLGLGVIFCLGLVDIVFDILRTLNTINGGAFAIDTIWDVLETVIAVIVSTLPSYRSLFTTQRRPSTHSCDEYGSENTKPSHNTVMHSHLYQGTSLTATSERENLSDKLKTRMIELQVVENPSRNTSSELTPSGSRDEV